MSLIAADYRCPIHGVFDSLEERPPPDDVPCPRCESLSPWCFPAPYGSCSGVSVVRGGVAKADSPMYLDTRPLAEGMPMAEFKAKREKLALERRHKERKKQFG